MKHPQTNVSGFISPHYRGMSDDQCRILHRASLDVLKQIQAIAERAVAAQSSQERNTT